MEIFKKINQIFNSRKQAKKILITSGGTKIKIDRVRSITNMSKGTFGSQIAESFFNRFKTNINLTFLCSYDSRMPLLGGRIEKKFKNSIDYYY